MPRTASPRTYEGACHCGALEFNYETKLPVRRWTVHACQCAFCRRHGALVTADPEGIVRFSYVYPDRLRRYRFALRTADFLLCRECGIYMGAVMMTGIGAVAAINLNALQERPRGLPQARPLRYQGESLEERRKRRGSLWTPVFGPV